LRIYYRTDTRAAGFLVGAMLVAISSPGQARHTSGIGIFEALGWGGWLVLVIFYNQFNEFQFFLCRGGILVTALATALLIIGASNPVTSSSKLPEMPALIFMNVHPPTGWEYYVNQRFVEGVARWPEAELIDWEAMAHSEQVWVIRDGTHFSYEGSEAYVNAIKEKLDSTP
jgi:hypothetical protein